MHRAGRKHQPYQFVVNGLYHRPAHAIGMIDSGDSRDLIAKLARDDNASLFFTLLLKQVRADFCFFQRFNRAVWWSTLSAE
jgi:hypothetical protein